MASHDEQRVRWHVPNDTSEILDVQVRVQDAGLLRLYDGRSLARANPVLRRLGLVIPLGRLLMLAVAPGPATALLVPVLLARWADHVSIVNAVLPLRHTAPASGPDRCVRARVAGPPARRFGACHGGAGRVLKRSHAVKVARASAARAVFPARLSHDVARARLRHGVSRRASGTVSSRVSPA